MKETPQVQNEILVAPTVSFFYEDELPDNYPYEKMFQFSWVDGVRKFPGWDFVAGYHAGRRTAIKRADRALNQNDVSFTDEEILAMELPLGEILP